MIHYTPEDAIPKLGLNFSGTLRGRIWFRVFWLWYDIGNYTLTDYYFRFCVKGKPHIYTEKKHGDVVKNYLFNTAQKAVSIRD